MCRELEYQERCSEVVGRPAKQRKLFGIGERQTNQRKRQHPENDDDGDDDDDDESDSTISDASAQRRQYFGQLRGHKGVTKAITDLYRKGKQSRQGGAHDKVVVERGSLMGFAPADIPTTAGFSAVGGLKEQIRAVTEIAILPWTYPLLFAGTDTPRGLLFTGPPGCGKTLVARALCSELQARIGKKVALFARKGADLLSKYVGESEAHLRGLFASAQRHQPSIIFFDEIDGLAPTRNSQHDHVHASVVATLLALLDGLDDRGHVLVIGATNRPDSVDPALRRPGRFDKEIVFPPPDEAARGDMLEIFCREWPTKPSQEKLKELAVQAEGLSGADMKMLVHEARFSAIRRSFPEVYVSSQRLLISADHVQVEDSDWSSALLAVRPSLRRPLTSVQPHLPPTKSFLSPLFTSAVAEVSTAARAHVPHFFDCDERSAIYTSLTPLPHSCSPCLLLYGGDRTGVTEAALHFVLGLKNIRTFVLSSSVLSSPQGAESIRHTLALAGGARDKSLILLLDVDRWLKHFDEHTQEAVSLFLEDLNGPHLLAVVTCTSPLDHPMLKAVKTRVAIAPPTNDDLKAFFDKVLEGILAPPPLAITPNDLRALPEDPTPVAIGTRCDVMNGNQRQSLLEQRRANQLARTELRSQLRLLLENLMAKGQRHGLHIFNEPEDLFKRLQLESAEEVVKLAKKIKLEPPTFLSEILENEAALSTVAILGDVMKHVTVNLAALIEEANPEGKRLLLGKVSLLRDTVSVNIARLDAELVSQVEDLLADQQCPERSHEGPGCPGCGLDDQKDATKNCCFCGSQWHIDCLIPTLQPPQPRNWACPKCEEPENRPHARCKKGRVSKNAAKPMAHPPCEVQGVDREVLAELSESATEACSGLSYTDLERIYESLSHEIFAHRNNSNKEALLKSARRIFSTSSLPKKKR